MISARRIVRWKIDARFRAAERLGSAYHMEPTAAKLIETAALREAGDQGWVAPTLHTAVIAAREGLRVHHPRGFLRPELGQQVLE
jgi:hypothetical protein